MSSASARLLRLGLAFWTVIGAYALSPFSRLLPLAAVAAADDNGLGAGGAAFAYNYTFVVAIILAFIFGFGLRDVVHRRWTRAQARKKAKAASAPPRA
jgi:hypothetical protein